MIKITVLTDNRPFHACCKTEHGLSFFVETDHHKILLDAGQSDIFQQNAATLGIDLDATDIIVLSHGHYDHAKGLHEINRKVKLVCHPDCCTNRYSLRTKEYAGIGYSLDELRQQFDVIPAREPYFICNHIAFLGEIPRNFSFEGHESPTRLDDGREDFIPDDSGLVISAPEGIIVISGCAHSGICNTVEYAKKVMNTQKILAVIGGFHLKKVDETTERTVRYFIEHPVKNLILAHCTADEVCSEFIRRFANTSTFAEVLGAGKTYQF